MYCHAGIPTLMPHSQVPQNVRYAMPGHASISSGPAAHIMYNSAAAAAAAAGGAPYGNVMAQWHLAAAAQQPAQLPGSDRSTPNPMLPPEYLTQFPPGMIIPQTLQPGGNSNPGGSTYSPNNAATAAPSPHPQQQQQ